MAGSELTLDDATKIIGCYKALTKSDLKNDLTFDPRPMKRALAFCQSIDKSRVIESEFAKVVDEYTKWSVPTFPADFPSPNPCQPCVQKEI